MFLLKIDSMPRQKSDFNFSGFYFKWLSSPINSSLSFKRRMDVDPFWGFLGYFIFSKLVYAFAMMTRLSLHSVPVLKVTFQSLQTDTDDAKRTILWVTLLLQSIWKSPCTMFITVSPGYTLVRCLYTQDSLFFDKYPSCYIFNYDFGLAFLGGYLGCFYYLTSLAVLYSSSQRILQILSASSYFDGLFQTNFYSIFSIQTVFSSLSKSKSSTFLSSSSPPFNPRQTASLILPGIELNLNLYLLSYYQMVEIAVFNFSKDPFSSFTSVLNVFTLHSLSSSTSISTFSVYSNVKYLSTISSTIIFIFSKLSQLTMLFNNYTHRLLLPFAYILTALFKFSSTLLILSLYLVTISLYNSCCLSYSCSLSSYFSSLQWMLSIIRLRRLVTAAVGTFSSKVNHSILFRPLITFVLRAQAKTKCTSAYSFMLCSLRIVNISTYWWQSSLYHQNMRC